VTWIRLLVSKQGIKGVESSTRKRDINTIYLPKQRTTTENEEKLGEIPSPLRQTEHICENRAQGTGHRAESTGWNKNEKRGGWQVAREQEGKRHSLLLSVSPATQSVGTCPLVTRILCLLLAESSLSVSPSNNATPRWLSAEKRKG